MIEDAGRVAPVSSTSNSLCPHAPTGMNYYTLSGYADADIVSGSGSNATTATLLSNDYTDPASKTGSTSGLRGVWRWADPDACGSGCSGPPNAAYMSANSGTITVICQNAYPVGGSGSETGADISSGNQGGTMNATNADCPWTIQNCGANDEPFSFHTGGCNSVFVDGSVRFLSSTLDPITLRRLVTRSEGLEVSTTSAYVP